MPNPPPAAADAASAAPDVGEVFRRLADARARLAASDDEIVALQCEAAGIPAPSRDEGERAGWFERHLRARGAPDVTTDGAGNVVARFQGADAVAPVVVLSHLDTVFPRGTPLGVQHRGARLVGPGINDNARGLAATLAIAGVLGSGAVKPRRPVVLVGTTGEEGSGDLRGAKHFFATHPDVFAAIALDGAGDDRIVHRALGSRRLRIAFHGKGGHSWSAYGTPNAVHAAAACAARLARLQPPRTPRSTLSVGRIGGGMSVNAIPDHAWLEVDARSVDERMLEWLEAAIRRAAADAAAEENDRRTRGSTPLAVEIERFGNRPSGQTPADHPLVRIAMEATRLVGRTPELALASTDANVPMSLGIPAVAIGGGGIGGDAHTDREWYENVEGPRGLARALTIILAAAEL